MFMELFQVPKPVIGMIHLPPLPGSARHSLDMEEIEERTIKDVQTLIHGGISGLLFENFGDAPFSKNNVEPVTVSAMTRVIQHCVTHVLNEENIPFGINVLRNDSASGLSIAAVTGASFIRVNVLSGVFATDQGIIEGDGHAILKLRKILCHEVGRKIFIMADVHTKHGTPLMHQTIASAAEDLLARAGADGIIVTGPRTGEPPELEDIIAVSRVSGDKPVLLGSGLAPENLDNYYHHVSGFIVGSYLKKGGQINDPVDPARVRKLVARLNE